MGALALVLLVWLGLAQAGEPLDLAQLEALERSQQSPERMETR